MYYTGVTADDIKKQNFDMGISPGDSEYYIVINIIFWFIPGFWIILCLKLFQGQHILLIALLLYKLTTEDILTIYWTLLCMICIITKFIHLSSKYTFCFNKILFTPEISFQNKVLHIYLRNCFLKFLIVINCSILSGEWRKISRNSFLNNFGNLYCINTPIRQNILPFMWFYKDILQFF